MEWESALAEAYKVDILTQHQIEDLKKRRGGANL